MEKKRKKSTKPSTGVILSQCENRSKNQVWETDMQHILKFETDYKKTAEKGRKRKHWRQSKYTDRPIFCFVQACGLQLRVNGRCEEKLPRDKLKQAYRGGEAPVTAACHHRLNTDDGDLPSYIICLCCISVACCGGLLKASKSLNTDQYKTVSWEFTSFLIHIHMTEFPFHCKGNCWEEASKRQGEKPCVSMELLRNQMAWGFC